MLPKSPLFITGTVKKGNAKGQPMITIPKVFLPQIHHDTPCHLMIIPHDKTLGLPQATYAYCKTGHRPCFYPPKKHFRHLIGHQVTILVIPLDPTGWITYFNQDNRINIPFDTATANKWQPKDLLEIAIHTPNKPTNPAIDTVRLFINHPDRPKPETNGIVHNPSVFPYTGQRVYILPKQKLTPPVKPDKIPDDVVWIADLLPNAQIGELSSNRLVIHDGRHYPIQTPKTLKLTDIAHYMGAYFADGDKRANTFGISASTIEQLHYYIRQQLRIVLAGDSFKGRLTYTKLTDDSRTFNSIREALDNYWGNFSVLDNPPVFRYRNSESKNKPFKWNTHGSIRIRGRTEISIILMRRLLNWTTNKLQSGKYPAEAIEFLCGILEGDGSVGYPSKGGRAHLRFSTNKADMPVITRILDSLAIHYRKDIFRNKRSVEIGVIYYLKILPQIHSLLFKYYPKRRKMFLERFSKQSIVRKMQEGKPIRGYNWYPQLIEEDIIDIQRNYTILGEAVIKAIQAITS